MLGLHRAMIEQIDAVVLTTARLSQSLALYRAIGLPLEEERHEGGPAHYACELGASHFALYEASEGAGSVPARRVGGATLIGFRVTSLSDALESARVCGATVVVPAEDVPWGRRAVLYDPDGRMIELNEAPRT